MAMLYTHISSLLEVSLAAGRAICRLRGSRSLFEELSICRVVLYRLGMLLWTVLSGHASVKLKPRQLLAWGVNMATSAHVRSAPITPDATAGSPEEACPRHKVGCVDCFAQLEQREQVK